MAEIARLSGCIEWIDLDFVEHQQTLERAMKLIQFQSAGLLQSNTASLLKELGVERSRKAIHVGYRKPIYSLQKADARITLRLTRP